MEVDNVSDANILGIGAEQRAGQETARAHYIYQNTLANLKEVFAS